MSSQRKILLVRRLTYNRSIIKYTALASILALSYYQLQPGHQIFPLPDVQIFDLRWNATPPIHMDAINPATELVSRDFQSLDTAHRLGLIHMGNWIYIVDSTLTPSTRSNPRILLLKRGPQLVTCPGMWGLVGEHAYRDERPIKTVRRAILEELGPRVLDHVTTHGNIRNLTALPVYYERDYGNGNGGRIDRQVTYIWLVEMNLSAVGESQDRDSHSIIDQITNVGDNFFFQFDSEVAETKWLPIHELERWVKEDTDSRKFFCHETMISLMILGLERLKIMLS